MAKKHRKVPKLPSLFLTILLAIAAIIYFLLPNLDYVLAALDSNSAETPTTETVTVVETKTITVERIEHLTTPIHYHYPAKVVATKNTQVSAEISGKLTKLPISVGSTLEQDSVIAEIDCEDLLYERDVLAAQRTAQQATVELNHKQLARLQSLQSKGAVSQSQIDETAAALNSGSAQIGVIDANFKKLQNTAEKCAIKAPFSGKVTQVYASLGQFASPGTPIIQIMSPQSQEIEANLRPDIIETLQISKDKLTFVFSGKSHPVKIKTIVGAINSGANTQRVVLTSKTPPALLNGANGELQWQAGFALPAQYMQRRDNVSGVFIYDPIQSEPNEAIEFFPIPSANEGRSVNIDGILSPETMIVIIGYQHINADYPVNILEN